MDTSPGGDYYTSPNSPTSSSRNWTEDMEGGRTRGAARLVLQGLLGVVVQPYCELDSPARTLQVP